MTIEVGSYLPLILINDRKAEVNLDQNGKILYEPLWIKVSLVLGIFLFIRHRPKKLADKAGIRRRFQAFSKLCVFLFRASWFSPAITNANRWAALSNRILELNFDMEG